MNTGFTNNIPEEDLEKITADMRCDILKMVHSCGRQNGHLGGCMSAVEILAVLYTQIMNINEVAHSDTDWSLRDRFILSKGHTGIAMYAALKQVGLISQEMIDGPVRGADTALCRMPKWNIEYGIECSVGSLGLGLGYANGLCEAFLRKGTSQKVYVMIGDGECDEGSVWESAAYAGHRKFENLVVIIDKNKLQLDGPTKNVLSMENMAERWAAFGFETCEIDGHNIEQITAAFRHDHPGKPLAIIANTVKGRGISFAENKTEWHDNYLSDELYRAGLDEIGNPDLSDIRLKAAERFNKKRCITKAVKKHSVAIKNTELTIREWQQSGTKNLIGEIAFQIAEQDELFALVYSDCGNRIGVGKLDEQHPEKSYEVGISEQNQVSLAAAMAHEGFHVMAIAYAPFITARVLDQIRAYIAYMHAPVCLIGLSAGMSSSDLGPTHTSFEDIANIRGVPDIKVVTPADTYEVAMSMQYYINNPQPVYIRTTMSSPEEFLYNTPKEYIPSEADVLTAGEDAVVLATGNMVVRSVKAAEQLRKEGIEVTVINVRSVKPMSDSLIDYVSRFSNIIAVEEHSITGGLGSAIAEKLCGQTKHGRLTIIGINDEYFYADTAEALREKTGLTSKSIMKRISDLIGESK